LSNKLCSVVLSARLCYILNLDRKRFRTRLEGLKRWNKYYLIIEWCSTSMVELGIGNGLDRLRYISNSGNYNNYLAGLR